ncbi:MAG: hypothetical protein KA419_19020 [Acidobacteria bacterium]|nr:hypothetical protein [Acidobacteriota bacterium]
MIVAVVQSRPVFGRKARNVDRLFELIDGCPAELYVLPELCATGYRFRDAAEAAGLADPADGGLVRRFVGKARERNAAIVFGFAERSPRGVFNAALLVTPDGPAGLYRKTHLFSRERELFLPGDTGFNVFPFRGVGIGLAVCFDWLFPEAFRTLALKGADLVAHPSNLVLPYCQRADFARAVENRVWSSPPTGWGWSGGAGSGSGSPAGA